MIPSEFLVKRIARILEDHKAEDLVVLDIGEVSYIADFFVICTGHSETHTESLAEEVEFELKKEGVLPQGVEGMRGSRWILLDYGSVVVHIFTPEGRLLYDLERIWNQAKRVHFE